MEFNNTYIKVMILLKKFIEGNNLKPNKVIEKLMSEFQKSLDEIEFIIRYDQAKNNVNKMLLIYNNDFLITFDEILKSEDKHYKYFDTYASNLITSLAKKHLKPGVTIYDPLCGSAKLLTDLALNMSDIKVYGSDISAESLILAKIRLYIAGLNEHNYNIISKDILRDLEGDKKQFDLVISEQPIDLMPVLEDELFQTSFYNSFINESPRTLTDFSFLLKGLESTKDDGIYITSVMPALLFKDSYTIMRKSLIESGYLKGIIATPAGAHDNFGISIYILIFEKNHLNKDLFIVDFSNQKDLKKTSEEIALIYNNKQISTGISKYITIEEIKDNNYNLNLSRYLFADRKEPKVSLNTLLDKNNKIKSEYQILNSKMNELLSKL